MRSDNYLNNWRLERPFFNPRVSINQIDEMSFCKYLHR